MSKGERAASIVIGIVGLVLMAIPAWETLERRGLMSGAMLILVLLIGASLVAYSAYRNWKDARHAEAARNKLAYERDLLIEAVKNELAEQTELAKLSLRQYEEEVVKRQEVTLHLGVVAKARDQALEKVRSIEQELAALRAVPPVVVVPFTVTVKCSICKTRTEVLVGDKPTATAQMATVALTGDRRNS